MENYNVEVLFVIDASGSMCKLADDTIGGFNGFIDRQKRMNGKAKVTFSGLESKSAPDSKDEKHYWDSPDWYYIDTNGQILNE